MTGGRSRRRPPIQEDTDVVLTVERYQHGVVERLERTIRDSSGRPSRPYRSVDTLAAMERGVRSVRGCGKPARIFEIASPSCSSTRCAPSTYRGRGLGAGQVSDLGRSPVRA
jgi:hypothetical protein